MGQLEDILSDFGIEVVPNQARRRARQTHAARTLERILRSRGEAHLRDVLTCILEADNNALALTAPVLKAVSALMAEHAEWWEADASAWLAVFDRTNLVELHERVKGNRRAAAPPAAIATVLYGELVKVFGPARSPLLFDDEEIE